MGSALRLSLVSSFVVGLIALPVACGFPEYGGFEASGSGGHGGATGAGGASGGCKADADCKATAADPVCDTTKGTCVACTLTNDACGKAMHCTAADTCVAGCKDDADCNVGDAGGGLTCDLATHTCQGCTMDDQCALGTLCEVASKKCIPGCTKQHGCESGRGCCGSSCADLQTDKDHCGDCAMACTPANGVGKCVAAKCEVDTCLPAFLDCNLMAADGCETTKDTSVQNCGTCGNACQGFANAAPACSGGMCSVGACQPNFGNCDAVASNGCEANLLTSAANCTACGTACTANNGTPLCTAGVCSITCSAGFKDCDADVTNGCEVNTAVSVNNCGVCGNVCPPQGGQPACVGGVCGVSNCAGGKGDCDGNIANGCEATLATDPANCGACGTACFVNHGTPACGGGMCFVSACDAGFKDCDGNYVGGCETNVQSSVTSCGDCGVACTNAHGTTACNVGVCVPMCAPGFADCDANPDNGCETDTTSSLGNCGGCGMACALPNANSACQTSVCGLVSCKAGFGDCDLVGSNGCEVPLNTTSNCGSCGADCTNANGTIACAAGVCAPTCTAGFASCDGNPSNGCEASTSTLTNCGGCGMACSFPNAAASCPGGTCTLGNCNAGSGNCDGNAANGCETDTNTSSSNCGVCNNVCGGGKICGSGMCVSSCPAGTADCDANFANGCEVNTISDGNNCGGCNVVCTAAQSCSNGACVACAAGKNDCDKLGTNGCEVTIATDPNNCGACGTKCGADGTCGCAASVCSGGTIYFSENFSDNSLGWTLGSAEWQIQPAIAQVIAPEQGSLDPATDHSSTSDNGVAGIVVGGNYGVSPQHAAQYLTSPPVDLSGAAGSVKLTFWRWLNTDDKSYTTDTVEVFKGGTWTVLWTNVASTGCSDITPNQIDAAWTRQEFDVTTYKNAAFQVRFGHATATMCPQNYLPWIMSGWNVDDLSLSGATCN